MPCHAMPLHRSVRRGVIAKKQGFDSTMYSMGGCMVKEIPNEQSNAEWYKEDEKRVDEKIDESKRES